MELHRGSFSVSNLVDAIAAWLDRTRRPRWQSVVSVRFSLLDFGGSDRWGHRSSVGICWRSILVSRAIVVTSFTSDE